MKTRKVVFSAVALVIGLPLVLVLAAAATFQVLNRTSGSIVSSGQQREYLLYVPDSYDPARPTPLVISMHAAALWPAAQMKTRYHATDVTRLEYTNCADDADVVLYTIREGGHAWPGGTPMPEWMVGSTSHSIDATREMWAFFSGHRRMAGRDSVPAEQAGGS
jgi:poly(3-hydroxybutyrate) depolymerase